MSLDEDAQQANEIRHPVHARRYNVADELDDAGKAKLLAAQRNQMRQQVLRDNSLAYKGRNKGA